MCLFISLQEKTKDCYKDAQKIPLTEKKDNKFEYEVKKDVILKAQTQNVTVVVIYTSKY